MSCSIHIPKASPNLTENDFKQMFSNFLRRDCVEQVDLVLMSFKDELYNMVFVHFYPNITEVESFYNEVKNMNRKYMLNGLNIQQNFKPNKQVRIKWTDEEKLEIEEFFRWKEAKERTTKELMIDN
jgi:hypothetical protein